MLTQKQQKWVDLLSDVDTICIVPFDPTAEEKFQVVKERVQAALGAQTEIVHRGATSMGISGQNEIDVYVPVPESKFDIMLPQLKALFGEPRSLYALERARFVTEVQGKHIDVFLINEECSGWTDGVKFEDYLKTHPEDLERYRLLKENGHGLTVKEYYMRKIEFINEIVAKSDKA